MTDLMTGSDAPYVRTRQPFAAASDLQTHVIGGRLRKGFSTVRLSAQRSSRRGRAPIHVRRSSTSPANTRGGSTAIELSPGHGPRHPRTRVAAASRPRHVSCDASGLGLNHTGTRRGEATPGSRRPGCRLDASGPISAIISRNHGAEMLATRDAGTDSLQTKLSSRRDR